MASRCPRWYHFSEKCDLWGTVCLESRAALGARRRQTERSSRRMAVEKVGEKYRCNICGNEVVVTLVGGGTLVCCGEDMEKIEG